MKDKIIYETYIGNFVVKKTAKVDFCLPEFSTTRKVQWEFAVDESSNKNTASYDMIIGTDLLSKLIMDLSFSQMSI